MQIEVGDDLMKHGTGAAIDSLLLSLVKVITTSVGVVSTMVLSRTLSLADYGTYAQGNLVITLATSMTVLGLTDASNYFFNRPEYGHKYVSNILLIESAAGLAAALVLVFCKGWIGDYFNNASIASIVIFIAFRPMTNNLLATLQVLIVSLGKSKLLAVRNLLISILKIGVVCAVGFVYKNISLIFLAFVVMDLLNIIWFYAVYRNSGGRMSICDFDLSAVKQILLFCIPMAVSLVASSYTREMSKLVVGAMENTENYAVFANCSAQLPLDLFSASFMTVLMPILTRRIGSGMLGDAGTVYSLYIKSGCLLVWPIAACLAIVAPEAVRVLYGEKYIAGVPVFVLYLITYGTTFLSSTLVLTASGNTKSVLGVSISSLVLSGAGSLIGEIALGYIGAAAGAVVINLLTALVMLSLSAKSLQLAVASIFPPKLILRLVIAGAFAAAPALAIKYVFAAADAGILLVMLAPAVTFMLSFMLIERREVKDLLFQINALK